MRIKTTTGEVVTTRQLGEISFDNSQPEGQRYQVFFAGYEDDLGSDFLYVDEAEYDRLAAIIEAREAPTVEALTPAPHTREWWRNTLARNYESMASAPDEANRAEIIDAFIAEFVEFVESMDEPVKPKRYAEPGEKVRCVRDFSDALSGTLMYQGIYTVTSQRRIVGSVTYQIDERPYLNFSSEIFELVPDSEGDEK
jgi:hypothetical protein